MEASSHAKRAQQWQYKLDKFLNTMGERGMDLKVFITNDPIYQVRKHTCPHSPTPSHTHPPPSPPSLPPGWVPKNYFPRDSQIRFSAATEKKSITLFKELAHVPFSLLRCIGAYRAHI